MDLISDLLILAFFDCGELLVCHPELCCLVLGSYSKIHNSAPVRTCLKKILSFLMCSRRSRYTFLWFSFSLLVRFFGTRFAQIFCMPNSSVKMSWTVWWFKFNSLPISLVVKVDQTLQEPSLWSHFCPFFMCKVFQNKVCLPLSQPTKNALCHLKTCVLDTACSP